MFSFDPLSDESILRWFDLQDGCAAHLKPGVKLRLIPELRLAVEIVDEVVLLWRAGNAEPEVLIADADEPLEFIHFSYSEISDNLYVRVEAMAYGASLVIPGTTYGPVHVLMHENAFTSVDGDILSHKRIETLAFIGAERATRYPDRRDPSDVSLEQIIDLIQVNDSTRERLITFFTIECGFVRLDGVLSERGLLLKRICETMDFSAIEDFITGEAYTTYDLPHLVRLALA